MFKKKWLCFVIIMSCAIVMLTCSAYAVQKISIYINGEEFTGLNAQIINNSVYVPIRAVSEALGAEVNWIQDNQTVKVDADIKMIASVPEEKTYLYALNEKDGMYSGLILSINGNKKVYDWNTLSRGEFLPELQYIDLNGDNDKKLVVTLPINEGTGVYVENIHIINPKDFSEYNIEDAVDVVKNNVKTQILSDKEAKIDINGKSYTITSDNVKYCAKSITYENHIDYEVKDGKLIATVGIGGDYYFYIGNIDIEYSCIDGKFVGTNLTLDAF